MNFLFPIAFIGLISVPIIIAMYLYKRNFKEEKTSSLFLWEQAVKAMESKKSLQKIKTNILTLLQVLIAILITLALSSPYIMGKNVYNSKIIILDASLSMKADHKGKTRFEEGKSQIENIINTMNTTDEMAIVIMEKKPYIAAMPTSDKQSLNTALNNAEITNSGVNIRETIDIVESLYNEKEWEVIYFGDDYYDFGDISVSNNIIGESIDNLAVSLLSYSETDEGLIGLAKVKNFSNSTTSSSISIFCDNEIIDIIDFTIEPLEESEIYIDNLPDNVEEISVKLTDNDSLNIDNYGYCVVEKKIAKKTLYISHYNYFLENILSILPNVDLYKGEVDNIENLSGYSLYIFDGVLPEIPPKDGHFLIFNPPTDNNVLEIISDEEIANEFSGTNVFDFFTDLEFNIKESKIFKEAVWQDGKVFADENIIGVYGKIGNQKILAYGFDLHNTDLPLKRNFPIFMYNSIQLLLEDTFNRFINIKSGDEINISISPEAQNIWISDPLGKEFQLTDQDGYFDEINEPGFYKITQELLDGNIIEEKFAVNSFDEVESNLLRNFDEGRQDDINKKENYGDRILKQEISLVVFVLILL